MYFFLFWCSNHEKDSDREAFLIHAHNTSFYRETLIIQSLLGLYHLAALLSGKTMLFKFYNNLISKSVQILRFLRHTYYSFPYKQYNISYGVDSEEYCNLDCADRRQLSTSYCVAFTHQY